MKNYLLIILLLSINVQILQAQTKTEYNFETKEPPKVSPTPLGENTVFKIYNINKFLYDVRIKAKQTEYNSEPPAVFSQVFNVEKKETTDVGEEAEKIVQEQMETFSTESLKTKSSQENYLYRNELMLYAYTNELSEIETLPDSLQSDTKIKELKKIVQELKTEITEQKETISELNEIINDEYSKIIQELYSQSLKIQTSYELLEEAKVVKNKFVIISMTDGLNFNESKEQTDNLVTRYPFVNNPEKLLSSFNKIYKQFKLSYGLYLVNDKVKQRFENDVVRIKGSVSSLLSEIETLKKSVDKYNYLELFQNINVLYSELNNENNFFVVSDPVQAEKDVINFDIKITPRKNVKSSSVLETREFSTSIPIEGGVKIDFSTGLFITTGLHNRSYNTIVSTDDSTKSIITENKNNSLGQLSLGALMHISTRTISNFKPAFSWGLGLNSRDLTNANLFIGASGMFGNNERFVISTGVSLANVDYLNGKYSLNTEINTDDIGEDITEKATRVGVFISFTYNITNKKKE